MLDRAKATHPPVRHPAAPTTAALLLALAAVGAPLGLVGCASTAPRAVHTALAEASDGSLVLQLDAHDLTAASAAPLPRSLQRRWAGANLAPDAAAISSATAHSLAVRLSPPSNLDRNTLSALAHDSTRQGTLVFTPTQATTDGRGHTPITILTRPAVTLTLVTPPGGPTDGGLRAGLARITFDADFLDAITALDPHARPADALWLALRGLDTPDLQRLAAARTPMSLPDAVRLADVGIDPAGLRQMERRGTIFRVEEWLTLADAGLSAADALALVEAGTAPNVDALLDVQQARQREALAAALEAEAAEEQAARAVQQAQAAAVVAEAEAEAERLEAQAESLEAQQQAAAQTEAHAQTQAQTPVVVTPDAPSNAQPTLGAESSSSPESLPLSTLATEHLAETPAPTAAPDFYAMLMAELAAAPTPDARPADTPADLNAKTADVVALPETAAPAGITEAAMREDDAELLADPADAEDPAESLVDAAMVDAGVKPNPSASAPAEPADASEPAASVEGPIVAAGDMTPTEPAERAVPSRYVELLGKLGITRPAHVAALYSARVPPKMIHRFQQAGVRPSVIELIDAHRLQLDPAAAQTLTDAGYDISIYDLALLDAAGVDPSYAAALFDDRFRPLTATQLVELWNNRVSVADIRQARTKALATPMSNLEK